jgi:EAL domain-containing protein (putative c-di-GMP-specific phosphodiesterase class I)
VVKIDRSFVARLGEDPTVVQAVVDLAGKLRLTLVAEGIEELEQWDILKGMGCDHGQGYYFARPMPAADLQALAAARRRPAPAA